MHARRTFALALLVPLFACAPAPEWSADDPTRETSRTRPTERPAESDTAGAGGVKPAGAGSAFRPEDIAIFWPLGSSPKPTADNPLRQGFGVHARGGFDKWITRDVRPLYSRGFRQLIVHNPLGNEPDSKSMDLDQAYDAHDRGRDWNIREFDQALQRIGREMPGMRVIVYIGTRENDLSSARKAGRNRDHMTRSASLFLLTGILDYDHVTLAFDAASNYEDDSPERHLVEMVNAYKRDQGLPVYVEPVPTRAWQRAYPWIALERYYDRHAQRAATASTASTPHIRIYNTPGDRQAWDRDGWAWIADCLREGHTPALGWNLDHKEDAPWRGMSAAQIAARASTLAARPSRRPSP